MTFPGLNLNFNFGFGMNGQNNNLLGQLNQEMSGFNNFGASYFTQTNSGWGNTGGNGLLSFMDPTTQMHLSQIDNMMQQSKNMLSYLNGGAINTQTGQQLNMLNASDQTTYMIQSINGWMSQQKAPI